MPTIAVFGGSFDPPHIGHALVVAWLTWTGESDEVWITPAYAHALGKDSSPFDSRVAWCEALAAMIDPSRVKVIRVEEDLPQPSYTITTLERLRDEHPGHTFRLVVGSDVMRETDRWHRWQDIEEGFDPIVVGRSGYAHHRVGGHPEFPAVSSTKIRGKLAMGKDVSGLVPGAVLEQLPTSRYYWAK
jgi:nicotinate-nucleotide adenylyltransferase